MLTFYKIYTIFNFIYSFLNRTFSIYNLILVLACIFLAFVVFSFFLVISTLIFYVTCINSAYFYFCYTPDYSLVANHTSVGQSLFRAFTEPSPYCLKELQILPTIQEVPIKGNPLDIDNIFGLQ